MSIIPQPDLSPQTLYRFFDANDVLLYIGITNDAGTRWRNHSRKKLWWPQVSYVKVEHFATRPDVEAAEVAAIKAERPLHNIVHNRKRPKSLALVEPKIPARIASLPAGCRNWTYGCRWGGPEKTEPLWLSWEVRCDPISDEYRIGSIPAAELWREYVSRFPNDPDAERVYGPRAVGISWYVRGRTTFESAPHQDSRRELVRQKRAGVTPYMSGRNLTRGNFLAYYTDPLDAETGEPIKWSSLPVVDKVWREKDLPEGLHTTKGGFIQEATGWKPAPLQPYVDLEMLARACDLARPSSYDGWGAHLPWPLG